MANIMFYGDNLQKVIRETCEESGEVQFHNEYGGRGMYGKLCVGISGPKGLCIAVIAAVLKHANGNEDEDFSDTVDMLLSFQQDQMGMDVILYWPELEPIAEGGQEENVPTDWNNSDGQGA
jgi:hypothetical protein